MLNKAIKLDLCEFDKSLPEAVDVMLVSAKYIDQHLKILKCST